MQQLFVMPERLHPQINRGQEAQPIAQTIKPILKADAAFIPAVTTVIKTQSARNFRSWHFADEFKDYQMALLRVFVGFSACRLNVEDE